ncbi:unnamed protein product [Albugo candida]|uniref:Uncharacterized protein n=1 Tax=Albugo candida TaxID=65357 RepID=A0A024G3D5_9STRA|nr:unnamed protein product [Albugo candida]|eukprot:CCI41067.1 unnamed protein product [Albugo candida]
MESYLAFTSDTSPHLREPHFAVVKRVDISIPSWIGNIEVARQLAGFRPMKAPLLCSLGDSRKDPLPKYGSRIQKLDSLLTTHITVDIHLYCWIHCRVKSTHRLQ